MPDGQTRSKHCSNMRLKDWAWFGATGQNVGLWMVRDNNEGNSGDPFYRSLLDQGTETDQEVNHRARSALPLHHRVRRRLGAILG